MWNKRILALGAAAAFVFACGCGNEIEVNRHPAEYVEVPAEENVEEPLSAEGKEEGPYETKEETVNVKADPEGAPEKITVTTRLSGGEKPLIKDRTSLSDIRNTEGDERYLLSENGELLWENLGEDIVYEGKTEKTLPVEVTVSYYLDGNKTEAEEMAGKSGHVKLRFDYVNHEKQKDVYVPFLCLSGVILDKDHFSDVTVDGGKVMKLADQTIAFGAAFPGLKESLRADSTKDTDKIKDFVEIEAECEDFSLEETVTLVSVLNTEETKKEENDAFLDFLGIETKDEEEETEDEEISIDIEKDSKAIKNDLAALSQQIMNSPTLSIEEKQAILLTLQDTGNHFSRLGRKLSDAKDRIEEVKDAVDEMEDLSDQIEAAKDRGEAVLDAGREYEGFAGLSECKKSEVSFVIETEKIEKE